MPTATESKTRTASAATSNPLLIQQRLYVLERLRVDQGIMAAVKGLFVFGLQLGAVSAAAPLSWLQQQLRIAVLFALCLVAPAAVFPNAAAAYITACPRVPRAAIAAATGLPHTAVLSEVQNDDPFDCYLFLWSGHKPPPGKQSKAAEKVGRLALLTVKSENLHEPYSEAHDNGFTNRLIPTRLYIQDFYTPFTISTFGAEAAQAGTGPSSFGKESPSAFQVIGLWWSYSESADVQIYLGQYHKSRLQLEQELVAIAARIVPAFGL